MGNVQIYQIDCKVYLMKSIELVHTLEEISFYIDLGLAQSEKMMEFHERRGFKCYVHSNFQQIEKDKIYKEGKIYSFSIRCVGEELKDYFSKTLCSITTKTMKGLVTTTKFIPKIYISKL